MKKQIKFGTDVKIKIEISDLPAPHTMDDIEFSVTFRAGSESASFEKGDMNVVNGEYVASLATSTLAPGALYMDVTAEVPDDTFPDGIMHLIQTVDLDCNIIP